MPDSRKRFLGKLVTASLVGSALGTSYQVEGQATALAATPSPAVSGAAHALALKMREFEPTLTDEEIREIAKSIDDAWKSGRKLHAGLTNGESPSPPFEIGD